jgi:hypothetical protein
MGRKFGERGRELQVFGCKMRYKALVPGACKKLLKNRRHIYNQKYDHINANKQVKLIARPKHLVLDILPKGTHDNKAFI